MDLVSCETRVRSRIAPFPSGDIIPGVNRSREIFKYAILIYAPFLVAVAILLLLSRHAPIWMLKGIVALGLGGSAAVLVTMAFGLGRHGRRVPQRFRVSFKVNLMQIALIVGAFGLQDAIAPILPRRLSVAASLLIVLVAMVIGLRPFFGYGRLGRELTAAAREEERQSWRD